MSRKKLIILISALTVCLLVVILYTAFLSPSKTKPLPSVTPTFSPIKNSEPTQPVFNPEAQQTLLDRYTNREPLGQADITAKQKILQLLPKNEISGVLYESKSVRIEYVGSADLFQVEILIDDIEKAKNDGSSWFKKMGLSQKAICILPVQFYLNYDVLEKMRLEGGTFSPLAPGC
jgi:hypothetical protein